MIRLLFLRQRRYRQNQCVLLFKILLEHKHVLKIQVLYYNSFVFVILASYNRLHIFQKNMSHMLYSLFDLFHNLI